MYDFPLHNFVDVSDNKLGCAILVDGIKEYEVFDDKNRTTAVTLFRAFTNIIQPSSVQDYSYQKGSQCFGEHVYRLAFYPHSKNWVEGNVYEEALNFNNTIRLFQIGKPNDIQANLPISNSFLKLEPKDLIFSCLKKAENENGNNFILRIYNPTDKDIEGSVTFSFNILKAWQVTLEEKIINEMNITDMNRLNFKVLAKKILSFKLKL
ncbi:MAG: glycosyl hydrolase-related protein, partial [Ignavibacteria bacterium]|nr:glycosyl hydrolase-related protein [Ignavibacteria bacterium]